MGPDEAMRHIEAIEAILNGTGAAPATVGTSGTKSGTGSLTLDRAQVEQLKMHLSELKKLAEKK
jgi:hypothetical protein